jgi:hypothetical protein
LEKPSQRAPNYRKAKQAPTFNPPFLPNNSIHINKDGEKVEYQEWGKSKDKNITQRRIKA